jgi:hypothetical protein
MNNDDNTCGSTNVKGYLKTRSSIVEYETKYKQKIEQYIAQEIERSDKIIRKYKLKWYGLDGATRGYNPPYFISQLEDEMWIDAEDIDGVEVMNEDCDLDILINKIKQGKIRIKKSK